jgi:hypothetical protein
VSSSPLSAVGACPPHDGVRQRWWINVASAISLIESSQKIGRFTVLREPWQEPSEALAAKLARLKDTVAKLASEMDRLRAIERAMLASPDQQISLTDPDSPSGDERMIRSLGLLMGGGM